MGVKFSCFLYLATLPFSNAIEFSESDLEATINFIKPLANLPKDTGAKFSHYGDDNDLVLTDLGDDVVQEYGAYCLDKSPFGYYFRAATNTASANKWVIYLEGGGLCIERVDCEIRVNKTDGSSTKWEPYITNTDNVLSTSTLNPFSDWNHIYMRYCSGDTWTGTNVEEPGRFGLWFSGHNQIEATLYHLNKTKGLFADNENELEIMLAGASAGGIGTNNNCDYVSDTVMSSVSSSMNPTVRCTPQSGMFFPPDTTTEYENRLKISVPMNKIASLYLTVLYSSYLDESCAVYAKSIGDNEKFCWEASYLTPHINTKFFIAQNFWDSCQIDTMLCYQSDIGHDRCPARYMAEFKNHTLTQLIGLSSGSLTNTSVGVWAPSCESHTDDMCLVPNVNDGVSTVVQGVLYRDALALWMEDDENPPVLIDDCVGFRSDSRPCNQLCSPGCAGSQ